MIFFYMFYNSVFIWKSPYSFFILFEFHFHSIENIIHLRKEKSLDREKSNQEVKDRDEFTLYRDRIKFVMGDKDSMPKSKLIQDVARKNGYSSEKAEEYISLLVEKGKYVASKNGKRISKK